MAGFGRSLLFGIAIFLWPFLYFSHHVVPVDGRYFPITNDFYPLYSAYKVYLLACLNDLRIPLWSPAESAGFPFYSNPFTQTFYPLNPPLALHCRVAFSLPRTDTAGYRTLLLGSAFNVGWFPKWYFAPIERLFGTFKSVRLSAGEHRAVLAYRPRVF